MVRGCNPKGCGFFQFLFVPVFVRLDCFTKSAPLFPSIQGIYNFILNTPNSYHDCLLYCEDVLIGFVRSAEPQWYFQPLSNQPHERTTKMKIMSFFKSFANDDAGAVTVDWVVLTAAIVGLGIVVMNSVGGGVTGLADSTSTKIGQQTGSYNNTP